MLTAIKVKSKNLFDGVSSYWNAVTQTIGETFSAYSGAQSAKILAGKGDTFTIKKHSAATGSTRRYIGEFDSNDICLSKVSYNSITNGVTYTPTNDDCVSVHIEWSQGTEGNIDDIMLNEGSTALPYEPYGDRIIPVATARKVDSKNLFDKDNVTLGGYYNAQGSVTSNANYFYQEDYIDVSNISQITVSGITTDIVPKILGYNANKQYVNYWTVVNGAMIPLTGISYIRVSNNVNNLNTLVINEGSTALPYEPYGDKIVSVYPTHKYELPPDPVFANNTWKKICQAGRNNEIPATWLVGDTKTWTSKSGVTYTARLIDKQAGRYTYADTNEGTHAVIELTGTELYKLGTTETWQMNTSNTNVGGWGNAYLKTNTIPSVLLTDISSDLAPYIPEVNVLSGTGSGTTSGTSSSVNKLFLPAEMEMFSSKTYSIGNTECPLGQFDYYKAHNTNADRVKKDVGTTTAYRYWLRSPYSGNYTYFCRVSTDGSADGYYANFSYGVSPCFAI